MLTTTLAQRLRHETSIEHRRTESLLGLPSTVVSRDDYVSLLARLLGLHLEVEAMLDSPRWAEGWAAADIDVARHARAHLLEDDLRALGSDAPVARPTAADSPFASFGEVLGLLYVLEGSALGGTVVAPMIRAALGDVPTRFYDSDGRDHPRPWRSLTAALARFDEGGGDPDEVVRGARRAFDLVGAQLDSSLWSSAR